MFVVYFGVVLVEIGDWLCSLCVFNFFLDLVLEKIFKKY